MKRILVFALLFLCAITMRAATPAFTSFISSNESLTIVSNQTTGKILFTVTPQVTNIVATSNCVTTLAGNTNIISVTGAGTAQANGHYKHRPSDGTFTNMTDRTIGIWFDGLDNFITNGAGDLYFISADPPIGAWTTTGVGTPPAPTSIFLATTNCYANPLVSLLWSGTMHIDATNGVDASATFGNASLPALTIGHGLSNAPNGSTALIRPGNYTMFARTNFGGGGRAGVTIRAKTNLTIIGIGSPVLGFTNVGDGLLFSDCDRLTIRGLVVAGTHPGGTNWPTTGTLFIGGILISNCSNLLIEDCTVSNWVGHGILDVANVGNAVDSTNNIIVRNCFIKNWGAWRPADGRYEGAAVAGFAGATVEGCRIEDGARGIEPYPRDSVTAGFKRHWVVRNNWIKNTLDGAIIGIFASNTNLTTMTITGNTIEQDIGWTATSNGSNELVNATAIFIENVAETFIKNNLIKNKANGISLNYNSSVGTERAEVTDNQILGTSAAAYSGGNGGGIAALSGAGGAGTMQRDVVIARNYLSDIYKYGMFVGLLDSVIENNTLINCNLGGGDNAAIWLWSSGNGTSNVWIRGNTITDKAVTPLCDWGIRVESGCKAVRLEGNRISNMLRGAITNNAGDGVVQFKGLPVAIVPGLTTNTYISQVDDALVGMTNSTASVTGRTNKLIDTIIYGHGTLAGHTQTTYDAGGTAAGTNIWLKTVGTQKIYPGGVTETNLSSQNYASITVTVGGPGNTNWIVTASYP